MTTKAVVSSSTGMEDSEKVVIAVPDAIGAPRPYGQRRCSDQGSCPAGHRRESGWRRLRWLPSTARSA
jgi:hypothetical protein